MVKAAVTDVVRPAVAAHDPQRTFDQVLSHIQQQRGLRMVRAGEDGFELRHACPLRTNVILFALIRSQQLIGQRVADQVAQLMH